jgi:hypothetical protein
VIIDEMPILEDDDVVASVSNLVLNKKISEKSSTTFDTQQCFTAGRIESWVCSECGDCNQAAIASCPSCGAMKPNLRSETMKNNFAEEDFQDDFESFLGLSKSRNQRQRK